MQFFEKLVVAYFFGPPCTCGEVTSFVLSTKPRCHVGGISM